MELYYEHERVATHARATRAGDRVSNYVHYPHWRLAGLLATSVRLREEARTVGDAAFELVERMLSDKPVDRLRAAQGVLGLSRGYGPARLEAACRRALVFGDASYRTVSTILKKAWRPRRFLLRRRIAVPCRGRRRSPVRSVKSRKVSNPERSPPWS